MWCPKCKIEYNEGITKCADCGTELIEKPETADFVDICEIRDEKTADEIAASLLHSSNKSEYVKKSDQYNDLKFSGITFIGFGILGGIYLVLTKLKIIPITYSLYIFCVISLLFAGFIISGILSVRKAVKIKTLIPAEEMKIEEVVNWMKEHITKELLESLTDRSVSDSENDLLLVAHIQTLLTKQFPKEEKAFLDMIADEYYEENFV